VLVALRTEDNADRISVFNVTRLMLPGSALRSPIVFMFPSESIFVRTTCSIDVFHQVKCLSFTQSYAP
jgi:hypothetical protein